MLHRKGGIVSVENVRVFAGDADCFRDLIMESGGVVPAIRIAVHAYAIAKRREREANRKRQARATERGEKYVPQVGIEDY